MKSSNNAPKNWFGGLFAATLSLLTFSSAQAQIIIGAPANSSNEYPFGYTMAAYQQVYAASDFSAPININGLTFFNTNNVAGTILHATYDIQLSTTSAAVNGLSNTFAANLGANNTTVFNGTLSGSASPSFTIPTSLFDYQPGNGNLLLTIYQTNVTGTNNSVFLNSDTSAGSLFSRLWSFSSTTTASGGENGGGLVTQFDSPAAVPEPSTWALLLCGLGLLAFWRLRTVGPSFNRSSENIYSKHAIKSFNNTSKHSFGGLIATVVMALLASQVASYGQILNPSFASGTFSGWNELGTPTVLTSGGPTPPVGNSQALIQSGTSQTSPNVVSVATMDSTLSLTLPGNANGAGTFGQAIYQTFNLASATTLSFAYSYQTNEGVNSGYDEVGFVLDRGYTELANTHSSGLGSANGVGFTNGLPYAIESTALAAGTHTLAFVAYNTGDNLVSSGLYVTNVSAPQAVPEPSTWALLLCGLGLLAFWHLRTPGTVLTNHHKIQGVRMKASNNTSKNWFGGLFATLLGLFSINTAQAQIIDFSTLSPGTQITTQYAAEGITFATKDANGNFGAPAIGGSGFSGGLSNSSTGEYPTTEYLDFNFTNPATVNSFTFNNYGTSPSGRGDSFYNAFSSGGALLGSGNLSNIEGGTVTPNLSDISLLQFSNGSTTVGNSWEFVVGSISYSETPAAVPEPSTWALMVCALGLLAYSRLRTRNALL